MTQKEFANLAKVNGGQLSTMINTGGNSSWKTAQKLAKTANKLNPELKCTPTKVMELLGKGDRLRRALGIDLHDMQKQRRPRRRARVA